MCSRHAPEQGADSIVGYANPDGTGEGNWAYVREPYRVTLLFDDGRIDTYAVNAMGPFDAQNLALEEARDRDLVVEAVKEVRRAA